MASAAAVERVVSRLEGARCEGAALGALRLVVGGEGGLAWQLESGAGVVAVRRGTAAESAGWPPPKATVEATERTARRAAQALEAVAGGAGRAAAMGAFMRLRAAASRGEVAVKGDLRALMALRGLIRPASGGGGGGGDLARPLAPAAGATPEALGALEERVLQLEEALADAQQERARQAAAAPPAPPPPAMVPARTQLMLAALAVVVAGPAAGPAVRLVGRWYWQGAAALLAALAALAWRARCDGGQLDRGLATAGFYARIVPAFVLTHRTAGALPPREAEALWDKVHAYWGERLLEFCVAQGGMFIKLGQSLSARPDAAPPLLVKPLAALQDAVPPRPIEEVHDTVCAALGLAAIEDGFEEFDDEPVGSASIAQVHRAVQLGGSGSGEVAVKVRKRGIEPLFRQDMFALRALAAAVAWAFPDHDRRELAAYLCEAVTRELDLQQEGEAMERVREGLARAGVRGCRAPRLVKGTRDVLVMEFIDGAFSLKDDAALKEHAVDRLLVCEAVGRSLAVQFFALGVWNADLHPGNILLQPDASAPANAAAVLIDFGNTCRFTGGQLRAFATLVHAAATNDASLIGEAFDLLGVEGASSGRLADLPRMLKSMRLLLCDTAPADEQRALKKQYFKWAKEDRLKRKELGRASGRRGNSQKVSFPSELLPFAGTILTFKGVCATLGVRVSPMSLFGPAAREVLLAEVAMRTSLSLAGSALGGGAAVASNNGDAAAMAVLSPSSRARLEGGVGSAAANGHGARAAAAERIAAALMRHLVSDSDGGGLGLQVAVFDRRGGLCEATVELAAGTLGALDGRAVTPATRFALHGAGGAVAAAWAKAVARERNLDPLAPMAGVWKACQGSASRAGPSLCDALTHIAGLEAALPTSFVPHAGDAASGSVGADDLASCAAATAAAAAAKADREGAGGASGLGGGSATAAGVEEGVVHHWTLGSIVAGLEAATAGTEAPSPLRARASLARLVAEPLGITRGELTFGLEDGAADDSWARVQSRLGDSSTRVTAVEAAGVGDSALAALSAAAAEVGLGMEAVLHGGEWLAEPRLLNRPFVRRACQPSANAWGTARALATLYAALSEERDAVCGVPCFRARRCVSRTAAGEGGGVPAARWTADGQQLLTFQGADGGEALAVGRLCRGACVLGMGGLGVAVLSNTLEADNACVVKLATVLCIELGIGVPLDF